MSHVKTLAKGSQNGGEIKGGCFAIPRLHDTTGSHTGCQTGLYNRFDKRVERTATVRPTGCQTGLYNRFDNRFDNRLYRVNGA